VGWHPGERAVQLRAGVTAKADALLGNVGTEIPAVVEDFLYDQPWIVLGAADEQGRMWVTALFGLPGFLETRDPRTLRVNAEPTAADPLAAVLAAEAEVGVLAIELPTRRRVRINARSRPIVGGIELRAEQVYGNCPKYISARYPQLVGDGRAPRDVRAVHGEALSDDQRAAIVAADTFFISSRAPGHGADASHRGGNPGFVVVHDERHLSWPDYRGNSIFNTLGNFELDPACGLLFVDFEHGDLLYLSGHATVAWEPERAAAFPGAERVVDYEVAATVHVRRAAPLSWALASRSKVSPPAPAQALAPPRVE
jgi:predicted pyridoxine 5'-phosphate oxidase superfamily flavin-nucleotide-binding protein